MSVGIFGLAFLAMLGLMLAGMPIAVSMALVGVVGGISAYGVPFMDSIAPVVWGVHTVETHDAVNLDDMVDRACVIAYQEGLARPGDRIALDGVVLTTGCDKTTPSLLMAAAFALPEAGVFSTLTQGSMIVSAIAIAFIASAETLLSAAAASSTTG